MSVSKKSFLIDFNPISRLVNTLFMKARELGLKDVASGRMAIAFTLLCSTSVLRNVHICVDTSVLAECSTSLASGSDVWQKMMEELSKNFMIAVCSTGCLCICKATTCKAENSCIICEAQAYGICPAVVSHMYACRKEHVLWDCPAYVSIRSAFMLELRRELGDRFDSFEKSSYVLGSEAWEEYSSGLLGLIKHFVLSVWEERKVRLYGEHANIHQSHSQNDSGDLRGVAGGDGELGCTSHV